ncbi:endonuclease [Actinophytocola gossypii]|uniref:Endonuclease n=1 Tax=Actinophytocola gossypii TaxID=2812003 RepID=A0ABT2JFQ1_9PSEU|nr:endonuclease [Actinophytocola gossypii]MCT2586701.1 endonuclease [Actinophytocola gossypii]
MATQKDTVRTLLDRAGRTYADEAGITLADKPSPLYRLLVLSVLLSARISADIAVAAARELSKAGLRTPRRMLDATWQQRVDALGRGHYVRYDESTATALGDGAELLLDNYAGDVRKWRGDNLRKRLRETPKLGPVGVDIFCREAQAVWPELRPHLDRKTLDGAKRIGLPGDADKLAKLVPGNDLARFSAALVRVSLNKELAQDVRAG